MVRKSSQIPQREQNKTRIPGREHRHRLLRAQLSQREQNKIRMQRAWSWHARSQKVQFDDEKFIFLWIAFNAAYGTEFPDARVNEKVLERYRFRDFVREIVKRDNENAIGTTLWTKFSGPVRMLLKNEFVFCPFWNWVQGRQEGKDWESKFNKKNQQVYKALGNHDVSGVLEEVLSRLYVLRNQIFHGGKTFDKSLGQEQVRDGSRIMEALVPLILQIMQDDIDDEKSGSDTVWGKLNYPRVPTP